MRNPLVPVAILLALLIFAGESFFGIISRWRDPMRSPTHYANYVDDSNWMLARVSEIPSHGANSLHVTAEVMQICDSNGNCHSVHGKILLYCKYSLATMPSYGDELLILATPDIPSADENPHQFNYRRHLFRHGILYTDFVDSSNLRIVAHSSAGLMGWITSLRQKLVNVIHLSTLSPSQQGIAEALFLGWDDDLTPETESQFRSAGITHLLCVSGLHVGIVALLVGYCLVFIGNGRRSRIIKGLLQIAAIWLFVALSGMAPGTTRAGLMFTLVVVGQMFYSHPPTLNAIAAAAIITLTVNPLTLFDVGFQMSYCSVIGIVLFMRPLETLIPLPKANGGSMRRLGCNLLAKARTLLCVSIVAQCCISPLQLFYFHQFSPYFLVANMLVVPFAALLLGSVIVLVLLAWWPFAFKVVGFLLSAELSATEWVTSKVASWPNALMEGLYCDGATLILAYVFIALLGMALILANRPLDERNKMLFRPLTAILSSLLPVVLLVAHLHHVDVQCSNQRHFDVYHVGYRTAIEFFAGHESYLLCDSATASNPSKIDFQTANNRVYRQAERISILTLDTVFDNGILLVNNRFIGFNGKTIRIVDRSNFREQSAYRPHVDYLLLRESPYITINELCNNYTFDTLIISSQNSKRRRNAWIEQCDSAGIAYKI